jgi:hypothetical protein
LLAIMRHWAHSLAYRWPLDFYWQYNQFPTHRLIRLRFF